MATDLEVGIRIEVSGIEVEAARQRGVADLAVRLILRESSDEKLQLESDGRGTVVRGERSEFRLARRRTPTSFPRSPRSRRRSTTSFRPGSFAS